MTQDSANERALSNWQRFAYSVGNFGVGLMPSIVGSWALYYYAPPVDEKSCLPVYAPMAILGIMLALGRVAEALINPFIGEWSDKLNTRWGRRIPFILFGTPIMVLAMIALWFPLVPHLSDLNAYWAGFCMAIQSLAFAAVVAPYLSLLPELTPHNNERITLSTLMAVFEVLGVLTAAAGAGLLIDAYKCGMFGYSASTFNGFMFSGVIFGLMTLVVFYITGLTVKERPYTPSKQVTLPFITGAKEALRNPGFGPYIALVAFFRIGIDIVIVVIPYIVTTIMRGEESDAVTVQLIVMVGAMLLFPFVSWLANRYNKKHVAIAGGLGFVVILPLILLIGQVDALSPMTMGYIIFGLATFPVAVFNVLPRPLLADIIDHDEKTTGFRREAMYNGMEGLFSRSASGLAWVVSSQLFAFFGNSAEKPLGILLTGPVGAFFVLIGVLWFTRYPFKS